MEFEDLVRELRAIRISGNIQAMENLLEQVLMADIADALQLQLAQQTFRIQEVRDLLLLMSDDSAAALLGYFPPDLQEKLVALIETSRLARLIDAMPHDERADLFNLLSEEAQQSLLRDMSQPEREDMQQLAAYEEGTVGSVMTSDFAILEALSTAAEGIKQLRQTGKDKETIYQAYVVDDNRCLVGTVSLRDLIMAEPEERILDFMVMDPLYVRADEARELAAQAISKYDLLAIPVLNAQNQMVGIVTIDDAMDVASEEADLDFRKVGAVGTIAGGLKEASIRLLYKKRVFWLVLLVFGNIFSGAGIAYFEETIEAYIALVFFLPLLVDSGGNAGSQSATLMVRALATGEIIMKDWAGMLGRELAVAGLLGATMAAAVSLLGIWRGGMEIALVVALTMQLVVVVGSVIGMSLPFLLSKLKFDPATASAPLITSIADACGVIIYFSVATMILDIPAALA
ncbi:Mg/Co/Ni transporter MgtE [Nitrincola lacisaponensis]|uniref:Magnesium transporter MgtE n=1 Tax=Nitrincola lacisaponensis TaxID=267850 RepID=A0A063Y0Q1_9GAMM|nr:magnesium transporter [Nitrincola lacisaponensis]KDE39893.1 Mg/Co/Ni transporter MgtE [Nitrincola lacisaponensis]